MLIITYYTQEKQKTDTCDRIETAAHELLGADRDGHVVRIIHPVILILLFLLLLLLLFNQLLWFLAILPPLQQKTKKPIEEAIIFLTFI
jgi:hypothetical protein